MQTNLIQSVLDSAEGREADPQKIAEAARLLVRAEERLAAMGCVKINLQILKGNEAVRHFYQGNGYGLEDRISMGKQIDQNVPG